MPPQEATALLSRGSNEDFQKQLSTSQSSSGANSSSSSNGPSRRSRYRMLGFFALAVAVGLTVLLLSVHHHMNQQRKKEAGGNAGDRRHSLTSFKGPYRLVERQTGEDLFDYYNFYDGPDSLGSAGYNVYVGKNRAMELGLVNVSSNDQADDREYVYMKSAPAEDGGKRYSVRLEGKRRYDRGLFILDVAHMPAGCGVWPAFWLTDESSWPDHGEIDVVEGVNTLTRAKTALHTSDRCDMYAHVPPYVKTGEWDTAAGIPNTWTGKPDPYTRVVADNCWNLAPHQWANQGCVTISDRNGTIGAPLNDVGGGVYALEWDPANRYIRSWVFPRDQGLPANLKNAMDGSGDKDSAVAPDPSAWGLPYAYFAIGETTGCSADHFQNMHLIFNLAFCGNVAGNRFVSDCPAQAKEFQVNNQGSGALDPVWTCNAYVASDPLELEEAYWKVGGVYVYERALGKPEGGDGGDDK